MQSVFSSHIIKLCPNISLEGASSSPLPCNAACAAFHRPLRKHRGEAVGSPGCPRSRLAEGFPAEPVVSQLPAAAAAQQPQCPAKGSTCAQRKGGMIRDPKDLAPW